MSLVSLFLAATEYQPLGQLWDNLGTAARDDPRVLYTAKCYWPGVTVDDLRDAADRALHQNESEEGAVFRGLLYLRGDETVLSLFEADSPASVRRASESVGMPCERVIESGWIGPPGEGRQL